MSEDIEYNRDGKLIGGCMAVNAINVSIEDNIEILPQSQGISESITQNWTEQALECYNLNCDCSQCSIAKGNYSFVCQMPKVLGILIKTLGEPNKNKKFERIK